MMPSPTPEQISDPRSHYGSGRHATRSFIVLRVSGALNVLFTLFFVWFVVRLAGAGRTDMVALVKTPAVAIVLALLVVNVCAHMRIGMQEVIEDYVHDQRLNRLSVLANGAFAAGVAVLALASIAKLAFWG